MSVESTHWEEGIERASQIAEVDDEAIIALVNHDLSIADSATDGIAFQVIARAAEVWGPDFSLRRIAEAEFEEMYNDEECSLQLPSEFVPPVEKWRKGSIHMGMVLAADAMAQFGTAAEPNDLGLSGKIINVAIPWSHNHLTRVYPVAISRDKTSPIGRELTLNQLLASTIITGVGMGNILSEIPQFHDVPDIERYRVGMYLAIRLKAQNSLKYLHHLLGALSSFDRVDSEDVETHADTLLKGGIPAWRRMESTIVEQSRRWTEFTSVDQDVLRALGIPVGRSDLTSLELLCRYYGWPFDSKMLELLDAQELTSGEHVDTFWEFIATLPQEPPRESLRDIGDRYGVNRKNLGKYISRAIAAIQTGDASELIPKRSAPIHIPGTEGSRDPTVTAERMTSVVYETLRHLEARDLSALSSYARFDLQQRIRLMRTIQNILASRRTWMPFYVTDIYEDLAQREKMRFVDGIDSYATEGPLHAASIRFPILLPGILPGSLKEIALELMEDPQKGSFTAGSQWRARNLTLYGLSEYSRWNHRFLALARAASLNSPDALTRIAALQKKCPEEFSIGIQSRLSYFRQYCAIAAISSGIRDTPLQRDIGSHLDRRVIKTSLRSDRDSQLMDRLQYSFRLFRELQETVRPGVMEDLVARLCDYLASCETIPLVDASVISFMGGYDCQFLSEIIYPDQLLLAANAATERYLADPEKGFKIKRYSTLFHYLNLGRRALLSTALG